MKRSPKSIPQVGTATPCYTLTVSPIQEQAVQVDRPETYRLPLKGGDPYFGLTRSWYYSAEKDGLLQLVRLRKRGNQRGVTLVPYDDVAAIIAAAKLG